MFIPELVETIIYSLNDIVITDDGFTLSWQGFKYYNSALFRNADFPQLLVSSFGEMIVQVPTIVVFSLFIASVLNTKFVGRVAARAIFFLPVVLATGIVLKLDLESNMMNFVSNRSSLDDAIAAATGGGFSIEEILLSLNLGDEVVKFISGAANGVRDIINNSGLQIFILLAAFQEIPNSLYEAASVEGCSRWETFWKITIPMVSRQIVVVSVYTIIDAFTKNNSSLFLYISKKASDGSQYAVSTSMYVIYIVSLAIVLGLIALILSKVLKKLK